VVGVDVSRRLLAIGRTRSRAWSGSARSAWITADATDLPFRGETFGACLLVAVLHHLPTVEDRRSALLEVQRILKPGASAFVSVWSKERARLRRVRGEGGGFLEIEAADVLVPWHLPDGSVAQRYYHLFEEPEFRGLIIGSGLREESFFKSSGNLFAHATRA
jgi:ubiquinone/menaquinone biosynthesis C-methylase UbiE